VRAEGNEAAVVEDVEAAAAQPLDVEGAGILECHGRHREAVRFHAAEKRIDVMEIDGTRAGNPGERAEPPSRVS